MDNFDDECEDETNLAALVKLLTNGAYQLIGDSLSYGHTWKTLNLILSLLTNHQQHGINYQYQDRDKEN